jgi:hypothetical protein
MFTAPSRSILASVCTRLILGGERCTILSSQLPRPTHTPATDRVHSVSMATTKLWITRRPLGHLVRGLDSYLPCGAAYRISSAGISHMYTVMTPSGRVRFGGARLCESIQDSCSQRDSFNCSVCVRSQYSLAGGYWDFNSHATSPSTIWASADAQVVRPAIQRKLGGPSVCPHRSMTAFRT